MIATTSPFQFFMHPIFLEHPQTILGMFVLASAMILPAAFLGMKSDGPSKW